MLLFVALVQGALAFNPQLSGAQTITCLQARTTKSDEPCKIPRTGPIETIAVQVTVEGRPVKGAVVTFESRGGIQPTAVTDALGLAATQWTAGSATDSGDVAVKVGATFDRWRISREIMLTAIKKSISGHIDTSRVEGRKQFWYAGRQLPDPITVVVAAIPADECATSQVTFKALGEEAVAAPDTARGFLKGNDCLARGFWKLGKTVGDQMLRVTLVGDNDHPITVVSHARATPWLAAGLAVGWLPQFVGVKSTSQSLQIVTKSAAAETTFTATKSVSKPETSARLQLHPIIGINTPIKTSWQSIRWSVAADAQHLTTDWFTGLSLTQLGPKIYNEDVGVDLHLMIHVARREVLNDASACLADPSNCNTHVRALVGAALALELNANNLLSTFTGLFSK
jgi:hypothetical protein